jgi:hydroxylaminobenzene mutase
MTESPTQKRLAMAGALLFLVGMVTGLWSAATLTGKVKVGIPHLALAAHLNGLLGGLWLIAVAWTFQFLRYGEKGLQRLAFGVAVPAWANLIVTLIASFLGVSGLDYTGQRANDIVAVLLQTSVVLPTLIASGFWVYGFGGRRGVAKPTTALANASPHSTMIGPSDNFNAQWRGGGKPPSSPRDCLTCPLLPSLECLSILNSQSPPPSSWSGRAACPR